VAEHRLWYTIMLVSMSRHHEAYRTAQESFAVLLKQEDLNPYFGMVYLGLREPVTRNLILWGEWGQALREVQATAALCEKNGDYTGAQTHLTMQASVHLHAMDFCGAVSICQSVETSVQIPMAVRFWHILIGSADAALGNHDRALEHLLTAKNEMDRQPLMNDWFNRMPLQAGLTELWLVKGDLARARQEAERFLDVTLATAEHTYQGLAWEANARVAMAAGEWERAEECVSKALSTIEGFEVPLAAWRAHGTAADFYARAGKSDLSEQHRELSRTTITKLANSLEPEDPLSTIFLEAPSVRKILDKAERIGV
jgi:tetratricopeptide (TPR) repeat protein